MQFTALVLSAFALFAGTAFAAPTPTPGDNGLFYYAELDQFDTPDCLIDDEGKGRTWHQKPLTRQCRNIDDSTVSFSYYLGVRTQAWAYSKPGCKGESRKLNDWAIGADLPKEMVCWNPNVTTWNRPGFQRIRSIMMD